MNILIFLSSWLREGEREKEERRVKVCEENEEERVKRGKEKRRKKRKKRRELKEDVTVLFL